VITAEVDPSEVGGNNRGRRLHAPRRQHSLRRCELGGLGGLAGCPANRRRSFANADRQQGNPSTVGV
jgi:hypothetical protein